jgi:hypothetical protein
MGDRFIIITFYSDMQFYHHYMMCYNKFTSFFLPIFHGFQKNVYPVFWKTDTICILNNFSCSWEDGWPVEKYSPPLHR